MRCFTVRTPVNCGGTTGRTAPRNTQTAHWTTRVLQFYSLDDMAPWGTKLLFTRQRPKDCPCSWQFQEPRESQGSLSQLSSPQNEWTVKADQSVSLFQNISQDTSESCAITCAAKNTSCKMQQLHRILANQKSCGLRQPDGNAPSQNSVDVTGVKTCCTLLAVFCANTTSLHCTWMQLVHLIHAQHRTSNKRTLSSRSTEKIPSGFLCAHGCLHVKAKAKSH